MPSRGFSTLVLSVTLTLGCSLPLHAQTSYGSVTGAVSDASGAAVVGADVTLTNVGTDQKHQQLSGADGRFQFVNLVPAT